MSCINKAQQAGASDRSLILPSVKKFYEMWPLKRHTKEEEDIYSFLFGFHPVLTEKTRKHSECVSRSKQRSQLTYVIIHPESYSVSHHRTNLFLTIFVSKLFVYQRQCTTK